MRRRNRILAIVLATAVVFSNQSVVSATTAEPEQSGTEQVEVIPVEEPGEAESGTEVSESVEESPETTETSETSLEETATDEADNTVLENAMGNIHVDTELQKPVSHRAAVSAEEIDCNTATELPSSYRSDQVDTNGDGAADTNYLPSAFRDQNPYGTCWAHAAIGACEASLIRKGLATNDIDLSESHLAYFFYKKSETVGDLLGNIVGDYNRNGTANYLQQGGSGYYTMWQLASWAGPVAESTNSTFVYSALKENKVKDQDEDGSSLVMDNTTETVFGKDAYHLQNCYVISTEDSETMKYFIMQQGAIAISYYSNDAYDSRSNDKDSDCYYYNGDKKTNHAVQIVGWDDNYSADNFVQTPDGNGAWLVKNSWGEENSYLAQYGYFWLSYYDTSYKTQDAFVYDCEAVDNYDHIYQYDGSSSNNYLVNMYGAANIFEAEANPSGAECLEAVSIGVKSLSTSGTNQYQLSVYAYDTDSDITTPVLSEEYLKCSQEGSFTYAGYHTIPLESPVNLKDGQKYAVVFQFSDQEQICVDTGYDGSWIKFTTAQEEGQSFYQYSKNGTWQDGAKKTTPYTVRIKAFTSDIENTDIVDVSLTQSALVLTKGEQETLSLTEGAAESTKDKTVTWKSADTSVATVTQKGVVQAVGVGETTIMASCNGSTASCKVTVTYPNAKYYGYDGALYWSLDEDGALLIEGEGNYSTKSWLEHADEITSATVNVSGITSTYGMFQNCSKLQTVDLSGLDTSAVTRMNYMFWYCTKLQELDLSGFTIADDATVTYMLSGCSALWKLKMPQNVSQTISLPSVSTGYCWVDEDGSVCTSIASNLSKTATYIRMNGLQLDRSTLSLEKGDIQELTVSFLPSKTAENVKVTWSSSDTDVVVIDDSIQTTGENALESSTGVVIVTAVGGGTAQITASCGGKSVTCKVTVTVPITDVSLDKTSLTLEKGSSETLTLTVLPEDTTEDKTVTWSSSDTDVVRIDDSTEAAEESIAESSKSAVRVAAVGGGTAQITASCGGKRVTCKVTVNVPLQGIAFSGDKTNLTLHLGDTETLQVSFLPEDTTERYSRHIILQEVGVKGQKKLLNAKVLIIGAGGLGAPAALYLAAAGVGTIGIVDADEVDLSNLQRQVIHTTNDLGKAKVKSAAETMQAINPDVKVNTYRMFVDSTNILDLVKEYDFIIDGTDNFPAKFLINDACVMAEKPFSHAGIIRFKGQLMTYVPGQGPCYRCVFKNPPPKDAVPTCKQAGVIGAMGGVIGSLQAMEAVKYIIGKGELLTGKLLTYDALKMEFHTIKLPTNKNCAVCGEHPTITELIDYEQAECDLKH